MEYGSVLAFVLQASHARLTFTFKSFAVPRFSVGCCCCCCCCCNGVAFRGVAASEERFQFSHSYEILGCRSCPSPSVILSATGVPQSSDIVWCNVLFKVSAQRLPSMKQSSRIGKSYLASRYGATCNSLPNRNSMP